MDKLVSNFGKKIKQIVDIQMLISVIALVLLILINAYEIFVRNTFDKSIIWIQDISILLMVWMVFLGFSKIVYNKNTIRITVVYDKFPSIIKSFLDCFRFIVIIIFFIILSFASYKLIVSQYGQGTTTASIPLVYYTSAVLVNAITIILIYINEFMKTTILRQGGR
ncbi:TRAP-type C4-dicarboxylate transport system, small permease component [Dethiosulfatibacter aminovorans DSM 17477]|uniref:TRAP-type C4-dicarboxylate transport system, small permease component n=1 Tax=Dethiosulfatibacter aminovorans DSM 17477 TaxID=1121476 RepID=A0A1M6DRC4_9FIRM|nr:TRAP transporter small permease [Dethiosulfatibacter aminovorans]SHI75679.1 TRAP-type C4-dicarboxylate transport system, small permease component [Dethiosulfatibacter aminovorans DSM 17477]